MSRSCGVRNETRLNFPLAGETRGGTSESINSCGFDPGDGGGPRLWEENELNEVGGQGVPHPAR